MEEDWRAPDNHPISMARAKVLMAGDLGKEYRKMLMGCCAPIYWFRTDRLPLTIMHSGTLTLVRTPQRLLGVTAAHVMEAFFRDAQDGPMRLQIMDALIEAPRIIDASEKLDLATLALDDRQLSAMGKEIAPLSWWPPQCPQESRGIMLAGYPGQDRQLVGPRAISYGLFTALGIARRVSDQQITWRVDRAFDEPTPGLQSLPPNYELGGISGGPLIAKFETKGGLEYNCLAGIISQAHSGLENVVAKRAEFIGAAGVIRQPP